MTREEAKRRAELYSAVANGKTIQIQCANGEWSDVQNSALICIDDDRFKYRVKPKPKFRPFRTQEECWEEMLKHQPFGWLKTKKTDVIVSYPKGFRSQILIQPLKTERCHFLPLGLKTILSQMAHRSECLKNKYGRK